MRAVCVGVGGRVGTRGARGWRGHTLNPWVKMYLLKINNRAAISSCSRWFYNLVSGGREGGGGDRGQKQEEDAELLLTQEHSAVLDLHMALSILGFEWFVHLREQKLTHTLKSIHICLISPSPSFTIATITTCISFTCFITSLENGIGTFSENNSH